MLPIHYWWKSYSELVRGPNTRNGAAKAAPFD